MNIVICDDDANMVGILHDKVLSVMEDNGLKCNIKELYDGEALVKYCTENEVDAVLVDVDMPKMDGFKAVEELQKTQPDLIIVFVSAHERYGCQSYDYQPFWFISKRKLEKLDDVLLKLAMKLKRRKESEELIYLKFDKLISVNVNELMYLKSDKHYIYGYTYAGEMVKFRGSLTTVYEQLKQADFVYVQQRYVINCRYIETFSAQYVTLKNQEKITVTRNNKMLNEAQQLYLKGL